MFAGACALALAVATALVASAQSLPIRDPDGVVVPTYVRLPIILLIAWLLDVVPRSLLHSRQGLRTFPAALRTTISERWHRTHVVFAVTGLGTWYVCYAAFRNLKSYVPFVRGTDTLYDDKLRKIDHALWFGHDPATVLHSLFGTDLAAQFFSAVYVVWIVLIPVTLAIALMWTRRPAAGSWYVTAVAVDWLLGVAAYFALPTLGPAYSDPDDFSGLKHTYTATLVHDLMRDRLKVVPPTGDPHTTHTVQTIAAFPSLHVGMMVTICLFVTLAGLARWIRITAWVYLVLTILSTIYFGWHFSVDAFGGAMIGALGVWIAAIGTGNHVRGRPKLIERGTHEDPVDEVHPSEPASRLA